MKEYPHYLIGVITATDQFGRLVKGSAGMISPDLIVTAAHLIIDRKYGVIYPVSNNYGSTYKDFKFYPAVYGVLDY